MTASSYIFDPVTPRGRRVIKTRQQPWHRFLDPGVDNGDGIPIDPLRLGGLLRYCVELKDTFDTTAEGGPETVAIIERTIALIVDTLPLETDRTSGSHGSEGGPLEIDYG
jgi:hypothetical protein